ncbi:urea transporter [Streptomyces misionensis]|uniref:urea transporter n=1 Tax=Streptomyces misionensis TaxID=67331 RepID=UPI0033A73632
MPTASQAVRTTSWSPVAVGRTQARGIAQVALSAGPWTGLLFLVALFTDDWRIGVFGLPGTAASTGTATVLRSDRAGRLRQGLEGYCGRLVGIALFVRLGASWRTALLAVLAAAVCSVLSAAAVRFPDRPGLPVLTAPYRLVAGVMAIALPASAAPAAPATRTTGPSPADLGHAFYDRIGRVFFLAKGYAGLIVPAGLLVTSWRVAVAAACDSAVATVTAHVMGLPADRLARGFTATTECSSPSRRRRPSSP